MTPGIHPRPEQIAALSQGLHLPLPRIDDEYLTILTQGLERAFRDIRLAEPAIIQGGSEAGITALLEARLNA